MVKAPQPTTISEMGKVAREGRGAIDTMIPDEYDYGRHIARAGRP